LINPGLTFAVITTGSTFVSLKTHQSKQRSFGIFQIHHGSDGNHRSNHGGIQGDAVHDAWHAWHESHQLPLKLIEKTVTNPDKPTRQAAFLGRTTDDWEILESEALR
jgi:hypothetical protein